jgi:O-antigen ligase
VTTRRTQALGLAPQFGRRASPRAVTPAAGVRMAGGAPFAFQPAAKLVAWLVILGFALVVARLHEMYPPLSKLKPVLSMVILTTFATLSTKRSAGQSIIPFENKSLLLICLYWVWMFATIPTSIYRGYSTQFAIDQAPVILFAILIISQRASVPHLQLITRGFLGLCSFYAVLLLLFGQPVNDSGSIRYYVNDSLDPNDAAAFLAMGAPLALANARRAGKSFWRIACWIMFALLGLAILKTASRGGAIALVAGSGLLLFSERGIRAVITSAAAIIVLAVGWNFLPKELTSRLAVVGDSSQDYNVTSYDGRFQVWKRGVRYFTQNPVFGVGVGNFPTREGEQMQEDGVSGKWSAAHNSYVQAFAELGFAGGVLFCSILVITMRRIAPVFRTPSPVTGMKHPEYLAALGAFAVSATFLSHAYFWGFFALVSLCALAARVLVVDSAVAGRRR